MRQIKFRAWRDGEMLYQQEEGTAYAAALFNRIYKQHPVMQFTGLLDKNEKEVYAGDIISVEGPNGEAHRGQVKWGRLGQWIYEMRSGGIIPLWEILDGGSVIGNIYENPDLLK